MSKKKLSSNKKSRTILEFCIILIFLERFQLLLVVCFCFLYHCLFSVVSGFSLLWKWFWTPQGLHEWKKTATEKKKPWNLTWLLNQLSPVGKVGNVVLWDSFSVSISCLHVHLILNQPNPATSIQRTLPHLAWFSQLTSQALSKCRNEVMSLRFPLRLTCLVLKRSDNIFLHESWRFDLYIHPLLI